MVGFWLSATTMLKLQETELPVGSTAVQTTAVVPKLNVLIVGDGLQETVTDPELSVAGGSDQLTTPVAALSEVTPLIPTGHCITGAVTSCTVTLNVHDAVLLDVSVAMHVTVVAPVLNVEPEA